MKTISFFNGKGGVGKTLHSVMFASWLAYHEGARVVVFDLETPEPRIVKLRESELALLEDSGSWLSRFVSKLPEDARDRKLYDIYAPGEPMESYEVSSIQTVLDELWRFTTLHSREYDYGIFDFPGVFVEWSPAFKCIESGLVDLTVVPVDVDSTTRREGIITAKLIKDNGERVMAFWNNISLEDIRRPGFLESGEEIFGRYGVEFHDVRIKTFLKAKRDSDSRLFVKSTVCWPDRYVEMACPQVADLYANLKRRLDSI